MKALRSSYVVRRLLMTLLNLYLIVTLSFFLLRYMPGDPIQAYINNLMNTQGLSYDDAVSRASSLLSFDPNAPLPSQYFSYLSSLLRGNMGYSILSPSTSVSSVVFAALPWTLFTVVLGTLIAFVLGIGMGLLAAGKRGSFVDHLITNLASALNAIPNYIWAMLLIVLVGVRLRWFDFAELRGTRSPGIEAGLTLEFIADILRHAWLPIAVYVMTSFGTWTLIMKSSATRVLDDDFVVLGRAKGLPAIRIMTQYVGRSAILPIFSQFAIVIGAAVGGSVLIEQLFQYRGVGFYLFDSLVKRDYTLTQGFLLIITVSIVLANLCADLLLSRIDPRVRISEK